MLMGISLLYRAHPELDLTSSQYKRDREDERASRNRRQRRQIACGLAATAAHQGPCCCWHARRAQATARARASRRRSAGSKRRRSGARADRHRPTGLAQATFVVEAASRIMTSRRAARRAERTARRRRDLASTPPPLSVRSPRRGQRGVGALLGLPRVQPSDEDGAHRVIFPQWASEDTRQRALALCETFEKTPSRSPTSGLRRQSPAVPSVRRGPPLERPAWTPPMWTLHAPRADIRWARSRCSPRRLDVSTAIGEDDRRDDPRAIEELVAEGALGRKSGRDSTPTRTFAEFISTQATFSSSSSSSHTGSCDTSKSHAHPPPPSAHVRPAPPAGRACAWAGFL